MALSLKHKFSSPKADPADATLIKPSNWNDEHDLILALNAVPLGTGTGATELATGATGRDLIAAGDAATARTVLGVNTSAMVPSGGTSGQVLKKASASDYDATWQDDGDSVAMPANTFKANNTGSSAAPADITGAQATALLSPMVGDSGSGGTKGLVPAPAAGDASKALFGDGVWKAIPGGGDALTTNPLSQFANTSSAQLAGVMTDETGTGALVFATSPALTTPNIGTPSAGTLTNCTGLPIGSGVSGLGTGMAAFLATPSSANLATAVTDETGSGALVFGTSPTIASPVLTGTVDLSSASSGQIAFPATQNASAGSNVFDDYEEGTFTPAITFGGGSTGITYTTQNGIYTKIGRTVFYNIVLTLSAKGSSTGAMVITGLPFTAGGTYNYAAYVGYAASFTGLTGALAGFTAPSTTQVAIYQSAAATYAAVTDAAATSTTQIRISGFYQV